MRGSSLIAQLVKNLPAIQETWVLFLGKEDPLEKKMATHSSIFAWRSPADRVAWLTTVHGVRRVRHDLVTKPQQVLRGGRFYICGIGNCTGFSLNIWEKKKNTLMKTWHQT